MRYVVLFLLTTVMTAGCESERFDCVTYRGEVIALSRAYSNFHEYKDDPNNLPKAVLPRVAALVRTAPVARSYPTRKAAEDAAFALMFPGYGFSLFGLSDPVALFAVEVPGMGEDRYFLYVPRDSEWRLADDFLWPEANGILNRAELEGDVIRYRRGDGSVLRVAHYVPN